MISSSKKLELDQKVFKLIKTQIDQQTIRSQNKLTTIKNTPQTTKHSTRKCHIKKNLFNQEQKQNIPQGLQQMDSCIQMNEKQKTIKFITQKSIYLQQKSIYLQQKKQNYQLFFNSNNNGGQQSDLNESIMTIMRQRQQIQNLRQINNNLQIKLSKKDIKNKQEMIQCQKQRYKLNSQLQITKQQNKVMKQKIIQLTQKYKQKLNNFKLQRLQCYNIINKTSQTNNNNNKQISLLIKQQSFQSKQINCQLKSYENQEQNYLISRIQNKVYKLNQQLLYFIQLSSSLNIQIHTLKSNINYKSQLLLSKSQQLSLKSSQLSLKIQQLSLKQQQLLQSLQQINTLKSVISNLQQNHQTQILKSTEKQQLLTNQLNLYKNQYQVLKKRYFIMQGQFNKYSIILQSNQNQNLKNKYQAIILKYNCLYASYKSLYQQYINKSRQTDFVNQLCQSDSRQLNSYQNIHQGSQFTKYSPKNYGKVLLHCAKQSLSDCSDITTPLQHSDSNQLYQSYHPRIILKDLIKQTLNQK